MARSVRSARASDGLPVEAALSDGRQGDGRNARRSRNRERVLDAVLELFEEAQMLPSVDTIAHRSGVSLRSLYRYFEDQDALMQAAIEHSNAETRTLLTIHEFANGSLEDRISRLVEARVRLYEAKAGVYRATVHNAPRSEAINEALERTRSVLREQTEQQFATELKALGRVEGRSVAAACDLLTQLDSIDRYHLRGFTGAQTRGALDAALGRLLA